MPAGPRRPRRGAAGDDRRGPWVRRSWSPGGFSGESSASSGMPWLRAATEIALPLGPRCERRSGRPGCRSLRPVVRRSGAWRRPAGAALARGYEALASGDWLDAREAFAVRARSRFPAALDGLGRALWWLREERDAVVYRERAYAGFRRDGELAAGGADRSLAFSGVRTCVRKRRGGGRLAAAGRAAASGRGARR